MGTLFSTCMNTGTYGVSPRDAGVASATVNTGQQLGGSLGTSLFNTIATSAATSYIAAHLAAVHGHPSKAVVSQVTAAGLVHGYTTVFWWAFGVFLGGAVIVGTLMRRGPLHPLVRDSAAGSAAAPVAAEDAEAAEGDAEAAAPVATPE
jgi:hypothetical protein